MAPTMRCPGKSHAAAGTGTALAAQTARHAARILLRMFAFLPRWSALRGQRRATYGLEKSVCRPRQTEIFAQRRALVFPPEQTAPLQFRHHALDEIVEPAWQVGKHDCETVGAFGGEPFLHLVGDGRGRADHCEPGMAAGALGELPHREFLALRQLDSPLPAALAGIAFGDFGQWTIGVEARGIVAERDRQRGDGVVVVNEAVEPRPL